MSGNVNEEDTCTLTKDCCENTIYSAEEGAVAGIRTSYGNSLVTSSAIATATSTESCSDAQAIAFNIAQDVATNVATHDANLIDQTIQIILDNYDLEGPTGPAGPAGPVGPVEPVGPFGPSCVYIT